MTPAITARQIMGAGETTGQNRLLDHMDTIVFLCLLTAMNAHLIGIDAVPLQVFTPRAFLDGRWWRILTHPFAHVSWYHLLLDAGAFGFLYTSLEDRRVGIKLCHVGLCAGTSLGAALLFVPGIDTLGLCGLSGAAHGLMALSGLEMMRKKNSRAFGLLSFSLVMAKSIHEMITGDVLFEFMHMGLCGTALAPCHLGGVAGGILAFLIGRKLPAALGA